MQDYESQAPENEQTKKSNFGTKLISIFTGNILTASEAMGVYRHGIKIAIIVLIYISNSYSMYTLYRSESTLKREIKALRTKSVTFSSKVMYSTRQSEISRELNSRGINISSARTPHKVLE